MGLPQGIDLREVKDCFDKLWFTGMNSTYQIPISPVNLPKEVANNPKEVLSFKWILGEEIRCKNRFGQEYFLPEKFVEPYPIKIYGQNANTLAPEAQLAFKIFPSNINPYRYVKDVRQLATLLIAYPQMLYSTYKQNINTRLFDIVLEASALSSRQLGKVH